ncbi:diaminobutyrate--2-oxoglutarate transaminase [Caldalkalibacillus salinus]|uniref:diaminobutyrate--2-oxoglutarate transaminase n=1 Tax=Caldalkalibacillus salinus TaxID=2803787 RepID=UPI001920F7A5|nr:diaminobutyrate--2-oxoglutarate transaminase [Caldalkalibacillus salinus]
MDTTVLDKQSTEMKVFEQYESAVRSYCRSFPTIFTKAKGYKIWNTEGTEYIDFFAGAGALNYGHNNPRFKEKLIEYIQEDNITHSLDMATEAKKDFLQKFHDVILAPRHMDHKVMFPGPTGTNAVESALKIARKVTGRQNIISFTNAFHGMTVGSLAVTGNATKRAGAGIPLSHSVTMPFDKYLDQGDTVQYLERFLEDSGSGVDLPAAVIMETVQGEGGINAADFEWMKRIEEVCRRWDILLIVDDIQAGCGRTGTFFSFEPAGLNPDIICLSKSIGGYGLPLALTLMRPEYDVFTPGEHNGTFRGNNLAFVTATEALSYWEDDVFSKDVQRKSEKIKTALETIVQEFPQLKGKTRGRGFMQGIACGADGIAEEVCAEAFQRGLIMETSGPKDEVVKLLIPLIIDDEGLDKGINILRDSVQAVVSRKQ